MAIEADLWVLMAELATAAENRHKLTAGTTLVTAEMVDRLEPLIDEYQSRYETPEGVRGAGSGAGFGLSRPGTHGHPSCRAFRGRQCAESRDTETSGTSTGCPTCCSYWPVGMRAAGLPPRTLDRCPDRPDQKTRRPST